MSLPFKIKICGVTSADNAQAVAEAGADAIGLNFYSRSRRCITPEQARDIAAAIPKHIAKIGVFVNPNAGEVANAVKEASLDLVQFHGDEPASFLASFQEANDVPIIKALPMKDGGESIDNFLAECAALKVRLAAVLIDADAATGQYGGTGKLANWQAVARWHSSAAALGRPPLILAGGLTPSNVADAISAVGPHAVDTASGVESALGIKDARLVRAFVAAAKRAFAGA